MSRIVIEIADGFAVGGDGVTATLSSPKIITISELPDNARLEIPRKYRKLTLAAMSGDMVGGDDSVTGQLLAWFLAGMPDPRAEKLSPDAGWKMGGGQIDFAGMEVHKTIAEQNGT